MPPPTGLAPTDLLFNGNIIADAATAVTIDETTVSGLRIGILGAVDADEGDSFSYTLLDDAGGRFFLTGNALRVSEGSALDATGDGSYSITLRVTDSTGNSLDRSIVIALNDVAGHVVLPSIGASSSEPHSQAFIHDELGSQTYTAGTSDIIVYPGSISDYLIETSVTGGGYGYGSPSNNVLTVTDLRDGSPQGTDVITDAAGLRFADGDYFFSDLQNPDLPTGVLIDGHRLQVDAYLAENSVVNTIIGALDIRDQTAGDHLNITSIEVLAFRNVTGFPVTDIRNDFISVDGSNLLVAANIDFEAYTQLGIRVFYTDDAGNSGFDVVSVMIDDVNDAPTAVSVTEHTETVPEWLDTTLPFEIATLFVSDQDGAPSGYSFTFTGADAALFETDGEKIFLKAGTTFDFETKPTLSATLVVTDPTLDPSTAVTHDISLTVEKSTLIGDAASETLTGTSSVDQIHGSAGDDTIDGGQGRDKLTGGAGNDSILGGGGADLIRGDGTSFFNAAAFLPAAFGFSTLGVVNPTATLAYGSGTVVARTASVFAGQGGAFNLSDTQLGLWDITPFADTVLEFAAFNSLAPVGTKTLDILLGGTAYSDNPALLGGALTSNGAGGFNFGTSGAISVLFETPVAGFGFDILGLDAVGSMRILAFDINGAIIGDSYSQQTGSFFMGMVSPQAKENIKGFTLYAAENEVAGYAIDNLRAWDPTQAANLIDTAVGGDDVIAAGFGNDTVFGDGGADRISGDGGADVLYGNAGADSLFGGSENDRIFGGNDNDRLLGEKGEDQLFGGLGNDVLFGGNDDDLLAGGQGQDSLNGGNGADTLIGGGGGDTMTGGSGADVFVFNSANNSGALTNSDRIVDFEQGVDLIDLSELASSIPGGLFYQVVQGAAFSGLSGEVQVVHNATTGRDTVQIDLDGDATADMRFFVTTPNVLIASDFFFGVIP